MKIYGVKFRMAFEIEDADGKDIFNEEDEDNDDHNALLTPEQVELSYADNVIHEIGEFFIGSNKLTEAYLLAEEYIQKVYPDLEEDDYDIIAVNEIENLNVINWPEEEEFCPFCEADTAPPEDVLEFDCIDCQTSIRVVDGWDTIDCPQCSYEIHRDRIVGSNGKYLMIRTKE